MLRVLKGLGLTVLALLVVLVGIFLFLRLSWGDPKTAAPEAATGWREVSVVKTSTTMVASAHPVATEAGYKILQAGGSAIDAVIAVQAGLTLAEPQSSGIGGGAFLLYWDNANKKLHAYDGRETAPAAATGDLFIKDDNKPMNFVEAVVGGRSVGTPGVLRMLEHAHKAHGKLAWKDTFAPAIISCREGFKVTPRLFKLLHQDPLFRTQPNPRRLFYPNGEALEIGTTFHNPELAKSLETIAEGGADAFYGGPLAKAIVERVQTAKRPSMFLAAANQTMIEMGAPYGLPSEADDDNPGLLTMKDLADYKPVDRKALCVPFLEYKVCGFPPPTSGGITVLQILKLLEQHNIQNYDPRSAEAAHLFAQASRIAFADRDRYIADPDFVDVPVAGMLDESYLAKRAQLFGVDIKVDGKAKPGKPRGIKTAWANDESPELPSTSHLVVVDSAGNIATMTTSVENAFGARIMVGGFILNNQLTDFSFAAERNGRKIANRVEALKRPRSSMAPLMVFDKDGAPVMALGSPGGSRIIDYVAQTALAALAWKLSPQEAIELPHVINRNGRTELEPRGWNGKLDAVKKDLEERGHEVVVAETNSGLHAIWFAPDKRISGIDPRREGEALGD